MLMALCKISFVNWGTLLIVTGKSLSGIIWIRIVKMTLYHSTCRYTIILICISCHVHTSKKNLFLFYTINLKKKFLCMKSNLNVKGCARRYKQCWATYWTEYFCRGNSGSFVSFVLISAKQTTWIWIKRLILSRYKNYKIVSLSFTNVL